MATSRRVKEMKATLLAKGFRQSNNHHEWMFLYVNNKKTSVRTYFSHGAAKYERQLLTEVKRQIKLNDWKDFDNFMDCPMSGAAYLAKLIQAGDVTP